MKNHRLLCLTLYLLLTFIFTSCAPASLFSDYWDKTDSPQAKRTASPYADSPDAVIVYDLERMYIDKQEWDIVREHYVRIQVFTEAGKEYANVRIPYWHDHHVSEIKAQTILPDGRRIKLENDDIFEEGDKNKWLVKVFALPGVEDQCIIEYQYTYRATSIGTAQPKYFQSYLQTEYSKFSMTLPQGFEYKASTRNIPDSYIAPEKEEFDTPEQQDLTRFTWEFHDLPPIKDEPYMYNRQDHLFSMNLQMVRYVDQYNDIKFIKEWEDLTEIVMEEYDSYFRKSGNLKDMLAEIPISNPTGDLQPKDIFLFVRDDLTRSSTQGLWQLKEMNKVIKTREGSRVQTNLLLTALLREAGFTADPILIARRNYGKISLVSPNLNEFNHVIVRLNADNQFSLIDAGYPYSTFDLMPSGDYTGVGLVVAEGEAMFVTFPMKTSPSRMDVLTTCRLEDSGTLSGSFMIKSSGIYAANLRAAHAESETDEKFAYAELVDHIPGIIVDSLSLDLNLNDMSEPVLSTIYFQLPDYFATGTDMIYLPTTFYEGFHTNRLVTEERTHPLEFDAPIRIQEIVNLQLPEGFEIIESPKISSINGPGLGFQKQVKPSGGSVQILWKHQRVDIVQPPEKYKQIRDFYTEAVAIDQGVLVVKRQDS